MYKISEIAKYIITKCTLENSPINNLQLQAFLFCIQRDSLQTKGFIAFEEPIEAWKFGPCSPNAYYAFCAFGSTPIYGEYETNIDIEDSAFFDEIITAKRSKKPWEVISETQRRGGSWELTFKQGRGYKTIIATDLIQEYG